MRADLRRIVAAGLFLTLALGAPLAAAHADEPSDEPTPAATEPSPSTPAPPPSPEPTTTPIVPAPADPSKGVKLTNAQFRWGVNALLHKTPFYGKNFLIAGLLPDTRGQDMPAGQWKQSEGAVRIERGSGSSYAPATWAGFGTGADHQVVIDGGTGTVDAAAGAARITWRGSFGVARYSGQTGFSVSDPVLIVENGVGRIEATLTGFQVSRDGNGSGNAGGPIGPTTAVLANLGALDLSNPAGLTKTPAFAGVQSGHSAQKKDVPGWGSFPASFITFVDQVGQAPFWMTSGLDDDLKPAAPIAVSFNAATPIVVKPPANRGTKKPEVSNPTRKTPTKNAATPQPAPVPVAALPRIVPPVNVPPSSAPVAVAFTNTASLTAASSTVLVDPDGDSSEIGWWIAATFLLMSAAAVAAPSLLVRSRTA